MSRGHVGSTVANTDPNDSHVRVSPLNKMKPTQQNSVCVERRLHPLCRLRGNALRALNDAVDALLDVGHLLQHLVDFGLVKLQTHKL